MINKGDFCIGLVGCGKISDIYIKNCQCFPELKIVACSGLDIEESRAKARRYNIPKFCEPEEIFLDPEIDSVLNLTIPEAHAKISLQALAAGKHVYSEKPIATNLADGAKILETAKRKNLLVGNAPDTFLGGRWQTLRDMLHDGVIGNPIGVAVFVGTHGVERHHPNPDFYYKPGGGPIFDLGPYYITVMTCLFGAITKVAANAQKSFPQRMIENGPRSGELIDVEVDTHVNSLLEFASGIHGSMTISFDIWDSETPRFEIYGTEGTICIPDPDPVFGANIFGGEIWYRTSQTSRWTHQPRPAGREKWSIYPNNRGYNQDSRGLGLLDLYYAVKEKRNPRASGELAFHTLEVMAAILKSARTNNFVKINSQAQIPPPLPNPFPSLTGNYL